MTWFPIGKASRFQWLSPLLVLIAGILALSASSQSEWVTTAWYVLGSIALIATVNGIANHIRATRQR